MQNVKAEHCYRENRVEPKYVCSLHILRSKTGDYERPCAAEVFFPVGLGQTI